MRTPWNERAKRRRVGATTTRFPKRVRVHLSGKGCVGRLIFTPRQRITGRRIGRLLRQRGDGMSRAEKDIHLLVYRHHRVPSSHNLGGYRVPTKGPTAICHD
jgi:hypothetical protein